MRSVTLGISATPTTTVASINTCSLNSNSKRLKPPFPRSSFLSHLPNSGLLCRAGQVVELFPTVSPEIVVREARLEDCWEVAETHCSIFFPKYSFPFGLLLRINRLVSVMLSGFTVPKGCRKTCLIAVVGSSLDDNLYFGNEDFKIGGLNGIFGLNKTCVAGILTVDTLADFLPRKGPLRQRRLDQLWLLSHSKSLACNLKMAQNDLASCTDLTGIAFISNVAVREKFRRKGIAKRLIAKAEAQARSWGCRAIALHCELNNPGATKLYKGLGFKCIKVPDGANWPQPRTPPDVQFKFMMKLLSTPTTTV
ncbi:hypothetical protein TEA_023819 [Camellia sinensis var. sinensis]|uniref:N-acetyltransferase domain-containing protein n=1 Tax=Camellia sinensis var. sinensis TaxID=542762 RepID=A0A4S4DQG5_CAMSN|nr:hypothetical protein TEA_023819 [Camellia sinensis var. sinensis]